MSPPHAHTESSPPIRLGEDMPFRLNAKTLIAIIAIAGIVVASWYSIKADIADHTRQLGTIQVTLGADHDQLQRQGAVLEGQSRLLERMDRKLDFVTGANNVRPPAGNP